MSIARVLPLATLLALAAPATATFAAAQQPASPAADSGDVAVASAARAALRTPDSAQPWMALQGALHRRRSRLGLRRPDAAERAAAAIAMAVTDAPAAPGHDSAPPASGTPELTGVRIDGDAGVARLGLRAPGARFFVAPPVIEPGRTRLLVDVTGARNRIGRVRVPRAGDGPVRAIATTEDGDGTHLEIELSAGAHFRALPAQDGLILEIDQGGTPARAWEAHAPGTPPVVAMLPAAAPPALPRPLAAPTVPAPGEVRGAGRAGPLLAAPVAGRARPQNPPRPSLSGDAPEPLSSPERMLLLTLVVLPPVVALGLLRRRAAGASARSADSGVGAPAPAARDGGAPIVQAPPRRARARWLRASSPRSAAPLEPAARLWAARTLAGSGAPTADVARRTGLSRDALSLLERSARA